MINKMILQGRLVRDVELNTTASGVEVAKFTVAWSEKYKETETTCFLNCTAWRQTGVFVNKYFSKGQEIAVEGKLTTRSYEDKQGNKRTATELVVDKAHFCGSKADNSAYNEPAQSTAPASNDFADINIEADDDLPF